MKDLDSTEAFENSGEEPIPNNGIGLTSFIMSVIGFVTCGSLSLISLPLSIIGLKQEPRGTAVAGFILSLLGICLFFWVISFSVLTYASFQGMNFGALTTQINNTLPSAQTNFSLQVAAIAIGETWAETGELPDQQTGDTIAKQEADFWGNPLVYETDGKVFSVISLGPDGTASQDDLSFGPFDDAEKARRAYGIRLDE